MRYSVFALILLLAAAPPAPARQDVQSDRTEDVDEFMALVLAKREINKEELRGYVAREREEIALRGTLSIASLHSFSNEYDWHIDGEHFTRTLIRANGVEVPPGEQRIEHSKFDDNRDLMVGRDMFFKEFKPGNYFFAGRERRDGRELVVVEYYPPPDSDDGFWDEDDFEGEAARAFRKTSLIRMLVDPEEYQLVEMTLDNVTWDFLPGRWLVQVSDFEVTMRMTKVMDEVWLPGSFEGRAEVITAEGKLVCTYTREFYDYRKTQVRVRFQTGETQDDQ